MTVALLAGCVIETAGDLDGDLREEAFGEGFEVDPGIGGDLLEDAQDDFA